jgi:ribosomal protein L29
MARKNDVFAELAAMDATRLNKEHTKHKIARIKTLQRQRELAALGGSQ